MIGAEPALDLAAPNPEASRFLSIATSARLSALISVAIGYGSARAGVGVSFGPKTSPRRGPDELPQYLRCTLNASASNNGPSTSTFRGAELKSSFAGKSQPPGPASSDIAAAEQPYTTLPTPLQKIAPAHITHGSVDVKSVQVALSRTGVLADAILRTSWVSACAVTSPPLVDTEFSASRIILPDPSTKTAPKGLFPCSAALRESCIARRMAASA
mmetsp:Transcript_114089/g.179608  ORF Transcript_114089/g.179608 Transcript_114089/m.179608 type:complete len:215 (+) Transcript_114089:446-1090(+)